MPTAAAIAVDTVRGVSVRRSWPWLAASLALLAGLGGAIAVGVLANREDECEEFRFDASGWHNQDTRDDLRAPTPRQRLADRLISCRTIVGWSRARVRRVLGRPDNYVARRSEWTYSLGIERGVPIDYEHLVVKFDSHDQVASLDLVTD